MADEVVKKPLKVAIASKRLIGPFGQVEEGKVIPKTIKPSLVKQWLKDGCAVLKDGPDDVGHWNEENLDEEELPEDPLSGL